MGGAACAPATLPVPILKPAHRRAFKQGDLNLKHLAVQVFYHLTATIYEVARKAKCSQYDAKRVAGSRLLYVCGAGE